MVPRTPSRLPSRWPLTYATLLVLVSGCSTDPAEAPPLIAFQGESSVVDLKPATAPARAERKTTLTASQLREQYEHDQQARYRREEAAADDAAWRKLRRDRRWDELRRSREEQDAVDRERKVRRDEERRQEQEWRRRSSSPRSPGSQTDPWRSQQPSFDETIREIQQRQEKELHEKMLRHDG